MNTQYNILIADDEKPARVLLTEYVNKLPQLKLVGCCTNAMEAMTAINNQQVDILLTDIQMPDMSGVDLVKTLPQGMAVIFTTAYSDYAIQGYDLGVVDYLLKPIAFPRFSQAINKAIQLLSMKEKADLATSETAMAEVQRDHLMVKADRRLYKINFDEILYIESQREYVTFHTATRKIMALYSLKTLEEELPAADFIRIHKSYIISKKHIDFLDGNNVSVAGTMLPVGEKYKEAMQQWFEK
ncbi:MAG: response regulator transcription factor [Bacteroidales bacterium]|nr:response regulator transcription factor [Bacteroidales bacterium]